MLRLRCREGIHELADGLIPVVWRAHLLIRFANTPLRAIDYLDIEAFIADLADSGLSPSRI